MAKVYQFVGVAMIFRTVPFALCLLWLAYESHFSASFFVSTLETSVASIAGGLDEVMGAHQPAQFQTALASADGS